MSRIRILPEQLANQIAAGEVVERPASVVKELVENAIDAGAGHISVQVEGDGVRMIRIIDDGDGMDQDDILLSLERHATSKIKSTEELSSITTMGFRGEAIPSIAAVSRLTITSRTREAELGARAEVSFGRIVKVHDMGCARGTVMEVSDLFGNLPARRKFLKSPRTELAHIEDTLTDCALAHAEIGFEYSVDGKEIFRLPAVNDGNDRVCRLLFGAAARDGLVTVAGEKEDGAKVSGWLVPPSALGSGTGRMRLFINLRPVRDRMLAHAVSEGMQGYLMKGVRPTGVIFLAVDPAEVDVNVHPTKQEVRFRRPNKIHQVVVSAVNAAMKEYEQARKEKIFGPLKKETESTFPTPTPPKAKEPPICLLPFAENEKREPLIPAGKNCISGSIAPLPCQVKNESDNSVSCSGQTNISLAKKENLKQPSPARYDLPQAAPCLSTAFEAREPAAAARVAVPTGPAGTHAPPQTSNPSPSPPQSTAAAPEELRYLGQFAQAFLVYTSASGLIIVDQHAAQERLLYEELRAQYAKNGVASQTLLFPALFECSPTEVQIVEQYAEEIARLGLELAPFGGTSFLVKAVPAILSGSPPEEVAHAILERFSAPDSGVRAVDTRTEGLLATLACKAAVKAGAKLLPEEAMHLARRMQQADVFAHCPHGRPVARVFTLDEVKRWFKRL